MVFQYYSLMPWLTVRGNVALAVNAVIGARPAVSARRVVRLAEYVAMVGLAHAVESPLRPNCPAACVNASPWRAHWP